MTDTKTTAVATTTPQPVALSCPDVSALDLWDDRQLALGLKIAELMSRAAGVVPRHLIGNIGGCLAVACQAKAWRMNPFMVALASSQVHEKLLYEGKLVHAAIESSGILAGPLTYESVGDWGKVRGKFRIAESQKKTDDNGKPAKYAVPAWADKDEEGLAVIVRGTLRGEAEPRARRTFLAACYPRNSTLWATDPEQQIRYRAARDWARAHAPGVMLGVVTPDEHDDIRAGAITVRVSPFEHPTPAAPAEPASPVDAAPPAQDKATPAAPAWADATEDNVETAIAVIATQAGISGADMDRWALSRHCADWNSVPLATKRLIPEASARWVASVKAEGAKAAKDGGK